MKGALMAGVLGLAVSGCATAASSVPTLGVDFDFAAKNKCQGVSPKITLGAVPAGAATYDVRMTDLDMPSFRHWAQRLPARGAVIAEGAGTGYYGPCPPGSDTHRYRIEVTALDGNGATLARGDKIVVSGR